jgi:hypothetical protein
MIEQTKHRSLANQAFSLYIGDWKIQLIIYGSTFVIALAAALIADLGLGQPEVFVVLFTSILIVTLLFLVPLLYGVIYAREQLSLSPRHIISATLPSNTGDLRELYAKLRQDIITLQERVNEVDGKVEATLQMYEIPLNAEVERDLEMLVSDSKALSTTHYIQDILYKELTDFRLEIIYGKNQEPSLRKLILPTDMKDLLLQLTKVHGFTSVEEYLSNIISMKANKIREREEQERREWEEKRKFNAAPRVYTEQKLFNPSKEQSRVNINIRYEK